MAEKITLEQLRKALENTYPQLRITEMDNGIFWFSLTPFDNHDIIEHQGKRYRVRYAWEWTKYGNDSIGYISVYGGELDPMEAEDG